TKKQSHFKTLFKITVFNVFFFTDENCPDKPVFNPSRLVVKYGDPVSVTCSICQSYQDYYLELVNYMGNHTRNRTTILWEVENMTEWRTLTKCCHINATDYCCCSKLPITVYKPPDNVSFSFRNHSGPLLEGHQYTLQCEVHNVAPVENLIVTFYRGQTALGQLQSNNIEKKPVTEIFTLSFNTKKEDDGVQYWCEAKLELGPEGPQPPPVVTSEKLSATVNSTPAPGTNPSTRSVLGPLMFAIYTTSLVQISAYNSVSISFRNHSGPLLEGHQYTLQCEVHNVAPVENLTVTFYRGQTALGQLQSNNTEKKPVTEIFTLSINTRKEDDGVQYWCEAKLKLGPEGPQPPIVVTSEKFSATVNSTPAPETTPSTSSTPTPSFSIEVSCLVTSYPSLTMLHLSPGHDASHKTT
uniref:Ig-like domain-containing protein n=1 Tax=Lates calcarifer TaxID=8187 RepID=A0A4W6F5E1_LATCA